MGSRPMLLATATRSRTSASQSTARRGRCRRGPAGPRPPRANRQRRAVARTRRRCRRSRTHRGSTATDGARVAPLVDRQIDTGRWNQADAVGPDRAGMGNCWGLDRRRGHAGTLERPSDRRINGSQCRDRPQRRRSTTLGDARGAFPAAACCTAEAAMTDPERTPTLTLNDAMTALRAAPYGGMDDAARGLRLAPAIQATVSPVITAMRWGSTMFGMIYAATRASAGDGAVVLTLAVVLFLTTWRTLRPIRLGSARQLDLMLALSDAALVGAAIGVSGGFESPFAFSLLAVAAVAAFGWGARFRAGRPRPGRGRVGGGHGAGLDPVPPLRPSGPRPGRLVPDHHRVRWPGSGPADRRREAPPAPRQPDRPVAGYQRPAGVSQPGGPHAAHVPRPPRGAGHGPHPDPRRVRCPRRGPVGVRRHDRRVGALHRGRVCAGPVLQRRGPSARAAHGAWQRHSDRGARHRGPGRTPAAWQRVEVRGVHRGSGPGPNAGRARRRASRHRALHGAARPGSSTRSATSWR